jgi:hypothetical protein
MEFRITIEGDLKGSMQQEVNAGKRAVTMAMRSAAGTLKTAWRGQITSAGLGSRLSKVVQSAAYPKGQPSLNAAAMVLTKSPQIISAHNDGATIRSKDGFWLAIPLPAAGRGVGGRRISPGEWERKTGRQLDFVYRRGKTALLVDVGKKAPGNVMVRIRKRGGSVLSDPRTFDKRWRPMFILVPQVRLKKRLDLGGAAQRVAGAVPAAIVANWR